MTETLLEFFKAMAHDSDFSLRCDYRAWRHAMAFDSGCHCRSRHRGHDHAFSHLDTPLHANPAPATRILPGMIRDPPASAQFPVR